MYRGRPPPRGSYRPPMEGRGPPPTRLYKPPDFRDDRSRPRPPYHPGYHDHGPPDYRRSPPRRRYPSPGSGNHPGGEYWAGGSPRDKRSLSPHGPVPLDHSLVITVGNELTGSSGSTPSHTHDREYPPRLEYQRSKSRGRSRPRSRSRSPDRSRAKSRGRSKSRARSKSRPRSHSRSPDRSRAKSRGRSRSRSADRSRAKSRGRSKSRPRSRSRSKSRSRGRSPGRSYGKEASRGRSKSRRRSRSYSSSSSSSSGSSDKDSNVKSKKEFRELETARRRKELEEMLTQPTKSILKKRNDSDDSPSVRSLDSPRGAESSNISRVADQLLKAVKGMEPHMVATMLSELRSDPHLAQRAGFDPELKEILNLLGAQAAGGRAQEKGLDDIDDEEKFLYGDSEEPNQPSSAEPMRHHSLDLYGDVTEEALYGDYSHQVTVSNQMYNLPPEASPYLSNPPTVGEVYATRTTISPEQNVSVHVSNPAYPPGTEPLEESERKAVEEYEKIQDLLKTIGLDLGVTEISKMAARTRERLQGNKPPPKTPTRRRYSSGSSDDSQHSRGRRRRSHSGSSSSSSSRSRSCGRGSRAASWSSDDSHRKSSAQPKSHKDRDSKETKAERKEAAPPQQSPQPTQATDPNIIPAQPGAPIPTYPPTQIHNMMPPNYPPPGYGQYGNYLPYMHQQWPPMYPPPMTMPPPTGPDEFPQRLPYNQPYSKAAPEPVVKGSGKISVPDVEKWEASGKTSSHDRRVSEEENNESEKQKVLEEREKLRQERELRMKKKEYLMKELERLRKQQGELLRKKRREKDGHKDPLLQEISHLQEDVMSQISNLRKEHEAAEKKRSEIDAVAQILGLDPSDRPRRPSKQAEEQEVEQSKQTPPQKKKRVAEESPEGRPATSSTTKKTSKEPPSTPKVTADKPPVSAPPPSTPPVPPPDPFEYYDAGNHWCINCNVTSGSMFDFFTHLHSKSHRKTLDPYDRPWASTPTKITKKSSSEEKLTKPAKGSEFMLPVRGFFCMLCKEFYGDAICAEEHITTHSHNENYKKQMNENPLYEQRRNLDRQAGLALDASGKKRKHEDHEKGSKDKEEKSKHKKEKKDKDKKKDSDDADQKEEKYRAKKEEQEDKTKPVKKEQNYREESDKYKFAKKDDKSRYSREEETDKYSKREEEDRYKYSREEEFRHKHRRDEADRHNDHPKYGPRDDDDRYRYGKYSDFRSKTDREREEEKPKGEKEAFKKPGPEKPAAKPVVSKPEPPQKPFELSKVFCGPSPAMRAKLRKQSQEAGKPANIAGTTSFGKFTWKKRDNVLAKEAQKAAAEFIRDEEETAKSVSAEDSFAKSVAVAKEIAEKLGTHPKMPPPWVSNFGNRGRIRPNLRAPAAVMRRGAMMGRPAPLNTFLSIGPQGSNIQGPTLEDLPILDEHTNTMSLPSRPPDPTSGAEPGRVGIGPSLSAPVPESSKAKTDPPVPVPALVEAKPTTLFSRPAESEDKTQKSVPKPAPIEVGSAPPALKPSSSVVNAAPTVSKPTPREVNSAPRVSKLVSYPPAPPVSGPVGFDAKPVSSGSKPTPFKFVPAPSSFITPAPINVKPSQPAMMKIVSDVAAPGVPESEQTHTVFVKPPPFMNMGEGAQKSEKLKSSLAAAKAKDLFDIFYSGTSQSKTSSFTKAATETKMGSSTPNKAVLPPLQPPKKQSPVSTQSQFPAVVCVAKQPDSKIPSPNLQIEQEADKNPSGSQNQPAPDNNPPSSQTQSEAGKSSPSFQTQTGIDKNLQSSGTQPEADKNPPSFHTQTGTDKNPPSSETQTGSDKNLPRSQTQPEADINLPSSQTRPEADINLPSSQTRPEADKNLPSSQTQPEADKNLPNPETNPELDIKISSVWSLQPAIAPKPDSAPSKKTLPPSQPTVSPDALQSKSLNDKPASQIIVTDAEPEQTNQTQPQPSLSPQIQTDQQSETLTSQDNQPPSDQDTSLDTSPPKTGRKTRGKATQKKTQPVSRPVRQTRSQTRYQTRHQQQQGQSDPEHASGDSDSAASDSKGLDTSDLGPGLQPGEAATEEGDPMEMEITPETLGLPSDMTSLDFDYDFNFE